MELRDFFTEKEVKEMKKRIVDQACSYSFLVTEKKEDPDEGRYKVKRLNYEIEKAVESITVQLVKDYVKEIIDTVVKEKISQAAERFTNHLVNQLDKIADKTNWYWSIK